MNKKSLLNFWLLLLCMIVGSGTAWADDVTSTLDFTAKCNGSGTADDGAVWTVTSDGAESNFDNAKGIHYGTNSAQVKYIQLSTSDIPGTITKVVVNASAASGVSATVSVTVGGSAFGGDVKSVTSSATDYTFEGSASGEIVVTLQKPSKAAKALYVKSVAVTYTSGGSVPSSYSVTYDANGATSGEVPTDNTDYSSGATVTVLGNTGYLVKTGCAFGGWNTQANGEGTNYDEDDTFEISANTTLYAKWNPYAITALSNNDSYGTVSGTTTITATPNSGYRVVAGDGGYTVTSGTATVVNNGDNTFTVTPSSDCTITINFEAIPTHTAHFSVNGTIDANNNFTGIEGATIDFPENPDDISGKTFVGWVTTAIDGTTNDEPSFVTSATMSDSDITFYAVFAKVTPGTQNEVTDVLTRETTGVTSTTYTNWSGKSVKSDAVYAGNSAGDKSSIQLRSSNSNSGIVSTTSGGKVSKIAVTWNSSTSSGRVLDVYGSNTASAISSPSNLYNYNDKITKVGSITCETSTELVVTGDYTYVGLRSNSGAMYLTNVSITWVTGTPDTYSSYCTTVVAAAVEQPVITVAENPFLFSTTATITCATDGAAIMYSYDGENWDDYSEALTITETKTIYAKATKSDDESAVAQVTATKNLAESTVTVSGDLTLDLNGETNVEAGTLTAAVTYNEAAVEGAAVTWTSSNEDIATINAETGAVTIKTTGTVTFTATYAGNSDYAEATGTKTVTVTDSKVPGSVGNPYTVAQAKYAIDNDGNVTDVYVGGIVSQVDSYNSTYKSITYWISEDGTTANQFEVYSGKGIGGADFSSINDIQVGDVVVVKGNITYYAKASVYEFSANNQLVSLVRKVATPKFSPEAGVVAAGTKVTISCDVDDVTIYYTTDGTTPTTESTEYTEAITIDAATTINAFAVKEGWADSDVASVSYTVAAQVATPTFSPAAGTYTSAQNVEISTETEDATIYYTTDGTTPTEESTVYTEAITVDETMTIKAIAVKEGMVNSNVAEAAYTMNIPSIITDVTSVNAVAKGENGTINVTYSFIASDPEIVWYTDETATVTTDKPDWISASFDESNNIEYGIDANTGEARTAYLKVYGLDSETNDVYSSLITISQVEYVAPVTYSLATSITSGKHYLITNGSNRAMGYDKGNNRAAAEITISEGKVTVTAEDTEVYEFIIYGPDANGYYTIYDATTENEDGKHYLYAASSGSNYLKTQSTNDMNGKWAIEINNTGIATIKAKGDYSRNWMRYNSSSSIFSCYSSGQSDIYLYEKDDDTPVATTASVKLNASGYATFATTSALDFLDADNADFSAWQITDITGSAITFSQIKSMVEAGTGILVKGTPGATVNLNILPVGGVKLGDNKLEGITEATAIESDTYYGLSGNKFVKVNAGTVPAGKALLPASEISASARELTFVFNDGTTGISSIEKVQLTNDKYYNLNGQRVENPKKGSLYIVNGKKVIMK